MRRSPRCEPGPASPGRPDSVSGGRGFWSVTRHADLVTVSRDTETYSSAVGHIQIYDIDDDALAARASMIDMDPPIHTRLRRLVSSAFTPRHVQDYRDLHPGQGAAGALVAGASGWRRVGVDGGRPDPDRGDLRSDGCSRGRPSPSDRALRSSGGGHGERGTRSEGLRQHHGAAPPSVQQPGGVRHVGLCLASWPTVDGTNQATTS